MNSFHKAIRKMRKNDLFKFHQVYFNEELGYTLIEFKKKWGLSVISQDVPSCAWATEGRRDYNGLTDSTYIRLIF